MSRLLECVPNFSEGRDPVMIRSITDAIASVADVTLLHVDPGASANRTVVTFAGKPEAVVEAAFLGIKTAAQLIDMRRHTGIHPRMGATDVCPLVPISGISFEEAIALAHQLAKRVGEELKIPVYLYEKAAIQPNRKNLATIRSGEYEGFEEKILLPEWKPDYGAQTFNPRSGQTVIGVRDFLLAYNMNLNTHSVKQANAVAFDIREIGRVKKENGKPKRNSQGLVLRQPGVCTGVKAIGWYVEEYQCAQVSTNITDIQASPLHFVYEETRKAAQNRGVEVTGSEMIGMVPKKVMIDAGLYYLRSRGHSTQVSESALIQVAIEALGLHDVVPFIPGEKIIEYRMEATTPSFSNISVRDFADQLASEAPVPGGGSASALVGALGAALATMVANLSVHKKGWEDRQPEFKDWVNKGQQLKDQLLDLIQADTDAFTALMAAYRLPRKTETEKTARKAAIDQKARKAAQVPMEIMETAFSGYALIQAMAESGNPHAITDAGVAALCVHAAIEGAGLNVLINLSAIADSALREELKQKVETLTNDSSAYRDITISTIKAKI